MIGVLKSAALLRTVEPACAQPLRFRRVLNGIFWVLRSGAPWRDLPENLWPVHHLLQSLRPDASPAPVAVAHQQL